jgi:hypothetical protein
MTALHTLNASSDLQRIINEYIARCELILDKAFLGSNQSRREFPVWIMERFQKSEYPTLILHEDPVYVVGRYFGMLPLNIPPMIMERATKLARDQGW